jgi:hypothetical protein
MDDGRCETCRNLNDTGVVPPTINDEFRTAVAARNDDYVVIYAKNLLGKPRVIVVETATGEEIRRRTVGMIERIKGVFG